LIHLISEKPQNSMPMKTTTFRFKDGNELLSSNSGLALTGLLLGRTNLANRISDAHLPASPNPKISHDDVIKSMIGLLTLGKTHYDDIERFREDPFFKEGLGVSSVPSSPTLRQRLDDSGDVFNMIVKEESAQLLKKTTQPTPVVLDMGSYIPLDIDVTPMNNSNTKKEGVSCTYKMFDGYAPIMAYLGKEGYQINLELREGKQHSQKGTPEFLQETLWFARSVTKEKILVRMDSGNDAAENIRIFNEWGVSFIIKRNLRRENKQTWLDIAKAQGKQINLYDGKTRWLGKTQRTIDGIDKPVAIIFDITEQTRDSDGQSLAIPDIKIETYWTNVYESIAACNATHKTVIQGNRPDSQGPCCLIDSQSRQAKSVINSYHDHGESEQFHSEYKTDLDMERLPSGKFATNALVMLLGMVAFNIIRICGQESLNAIVHLEQAGDPLPINRRSAVFRRRIRSVLLDIMYLASHVTSSSRYNWISFGRCCPWSGVFKWLYQKFLAPDLAPDG
jgi:hypothetical protein